MNPVLYLHAGNALLQIKILIYLIMELDSLVLQGFNWGKIAANREIPFIWNKLTSFLWSQILTTNSVFFWINNANTQFHNPEKAHDESSITIERGAKVQQKRDELGIL